MELLRKMLHFFLSKHFPISVPMIYFSGLHYKIQLLRFCKISYMHVAADCYMLYIIKYVETQALKNYEANLIASCETSSLQGLSKLQWGHIESVFALTLHDCSWSMPSGEEVLWREKQRHLHKSRITKGYQHLQKPGTGHGTDDSQEPLKRNSYPTPGSRAVTE